MLSRWQTHNNFIFIYMIAISGIGFVASHFPKNLVVYMNRSRSHASHRVFCKLDNSFQASLRFSRPNPFDNIYG